MIQFRREKILKIATKTTPKMRKNERINIQCQQQKLTRYIYDSSCSPGGAEDRSNAKLLSTNGIFGLWLWKAAKGSCVGSDGGLHVSLCSGQCSVWQSLEQYHTLRQRKHCFSLIGSPAASGHERSAHTFDAGPPFSESIFRFDSMLRKWLSQSWDADDIP